MHCLVCWFTCVMDFLNYIRCIPIILVCVSLILTSLMLFYRWKCRKQLTFARSFPVVYPRKWIVGNMNLFLSKNKPRVSILGFTKTLGDILKAAAEKRFPTFCLWIGPKPLVFIQNPLDIQAILNNSKSIDKGFEATKIIFGEGLIMAPGPKWRRSRKLIGPIFHPSNLKNMVPIWNDSSRRLVDQLSAQVNSGPADVFPQVMRSSLRSLCAIMFGPQAINILDDKAINAGMECMHIGVEIITNRCLYPWLWSDSLLRIIYKKKLNKFKTLWNDFISAPLEAVMNREDCDSSKEERIENDEEGRDRLPSTLFEALYNATTEEELQDEMKTLFGTGTETVSVSLCSCLLILAQHQEIQEDLFKEITTYTGLEHREVLLEDLDNLPLLHRVIRETLRLFLVVPLMPRKLDADICLRGKTFPKGETVILSIIGLHYDPETYPNPEHFDPDRHCMEEVKKNHPYSFLPFGGGPRNCIGKNFAYLSLKISLIHIVKSFKITSKVKREDLQYEYRTTLTSVDGYVLDLQRRI